MGAASALQDGMVSWSGSHGCSGCSATGRISPYHRAGGQGGTVTLHLPGCPADVPATMCTRAVAAAEATAAAGSGSHLMVNRPDPEFVQPPARSRC